MGEHSSSLQFVCVPCTMDRRHIIKSRDHLETKDQSLNITYLFTNESKKPKELFFKAEKDEIVICYAFFILSPIFFRVAMFAVMAEDILGDIFS